MTIREKTDNVERLRKAMAALQTIYETSDPLWESTIVTREQVDALREGLNISRSSVDKDAIIADLNASLTSKDGLITELTSEVNALHKEVAKLESIRQDAMAALQKMMNAANEQGQQKSNPGLLEGTP